MSINDRNKPVLVVAALLVSGFVAMHSAIANAWSRTTPQIAVAQLGGTGRDTALSMVLDGSGNTFITGWFSGTVDFDPGVGIENLKSAGFRDDFVLKLDRSGKFVWVRQITDVWAISVAVDGSGNIYITAGGEFRSCAVKFDGTGTLVWSKCLSPIYWATAMNIDGSGNIYITGAFNGTVDFDPSEGTNNLKSSGDEDLFVLKF